ncbi:MAG: hypothetical protein D6705_13305 [Deltaproteobacteria bacterium]|nr:MAG: hypothetical protein D6705_13305 [Deltaproteobacteria bacterium]
MGASPRISASAPARFVRRRRILAAAGLLAAGLCVASLTDVPAAAVAAVSQTRTLSYPPDQVFPTAIRYLRVDRGYRVVESDAEAGFILFRFPVGADRTGDGSLEAYGVLDAAGRPSTRVKISTGAGPVHLPYTLLDGLAAKIRAERGQPPPPPSTPPKQPPPKEQPDAGDAGPASETP